MTSASMANNTRGKHRIQAELMRLEQESRILEEELDQLEKVGKASDVCTELLGNVETRHDPLLPATNGPTNPSWDRWFKAPRESPLCKCGIL